LDFHLNISQPVRLIFIWGLMGAGKSTTGKKLAIKLGWQFVDSDQAIEEDQGRTVAQIFKDDGEEEFRNLEKDWIEKLNLENTIVAVGGGTPCFNDLNRRMLEQGLCLWFDAPIGMLVSRIMSSKAQRPLIAGLSENQLRDKLAHLMNERQEDYQKAHLIFQMNRLSIDDLATYVKLAIEGK
jgi:shikimate kinase